jgi:transposase
MTRYTEILRLKAMGLSQRQIATSLRISRNTIRDFLNRLGKSSLSLPLGPEISDQEIWNLLYSSKIEEKTYRVPDYEYIEKELRHKGVTLLSLWGVYRLESRDLGKQPYGYTQFCKRHQDYLKKKNLTMTIPRNPGENTEVDWAGSTLFLQDEITGDPIPVYLFVATLSFSGYSYFEGFLNMKTPNWISANVHSVEFFGGSTPIFTPDNLKTGVTMPHWYEPELHQAYLEFAEHYHTAILPARVRKPKDKPNAENSVKIATSWIIAELRHKTFFTLEDINMAIWERMDYFNSRPFQKKPGSRQSLFLEQEQQYLSPLPPYSFEYSERREATVAPDFHISFDYCLYSVPYKLVRKKVTVKATSTKVSIICNGVEVAHHDRGLHKGQRRTDPNHLPDEYREYASWSGPSFRYRAKTIGEHTYQVIHHILGSYEFEVQAFRRCVGILNLSRKYSPEHLERACSIAVEDKRFSYKYIKNLLDAASIPEPSPHLSSTPASDKPFARPKGFYSVITSDKEVQS